MTSRQEYKKQYYKKNKEKIRDYFKQWYQDNRIRQLESVKQYRKENKSKIFKYQNQYQKERRSVDVQFLLAYNLRSRLCMAIKKDYKSGSAVRDLGCSIEFFKQYIESKFEKDMTWKNYGLGIGKWNIDHIVPLDSFDLSDREQFLKACHYTNLQPLWQVDNSKKGSKI